MWSRRAAYVIVAGNCKVSRAAVITRAAFPRRRNPANTLDHSYIGWGTGTQSTGNVVMQPSTHWIRRRFTSSMPTAGALR